MLIQRQDFFSVNRLVFSNYANNMRLFICLLWTIAYSGNARNGWGGEWSHGASPLKITPVKGFSWAFLQVFLYFPLHAYLYPYCAICLVYSHGCVRECKWCTRAHVHACLTFFYHFLTVCDSVHSLCFSRALCNYMSASITNMCSLLSFSLSCSGECSAMCDQQYPLYLLWSWHILSCV